MFFVLQTISIDADYFRLTEELGAGWHVKGTPLCMEDAIVA